jgi:hypothetical protein
LSTRAVHAFATGSTRDRLAGGAFAEPGELSAQHVSSDGPWRIPVGDDEGFTLSLHPSANTPPGATRDRRAQSFRSNRDRNARLRAELTASVAAAELALMREQMGNWREIALEREHALDRAAAAVTNLSEAIAALASETRPPKPDADRGLSFVVWPPLPELADIPAHVRDAARNALRKDSASTPRRWWEGRR